jgi:DNA-binding transcriptional LysR family regulator
MSKTMEKRYTQLVSFYYVVDFMSFTKAAAHLHCSKAYISKQVTDLEQQVGSALLHRNTRTLKLTLAGEALFVHAKCIVEELQFAENTMNSLHHKAEGILRITSPSGYADYLLAPHLPQFLNQYPNITLEMKHCGDFLNLVKEKIDIAIRITHEPPLDRVAKRLGYDRMVICASEEYFKKYGQPTKPMQLLEHYCLVYSPQKSVNHWPFYEDNKLITITVKPKVFSNSTQILLKAALDGVGLVRLPHFVVSQSIKEKKLYPVLYDFYTEDIPVYAIFSQSRIIPPKVHAFLQFLESIHHSLKVI